MRGLLIRWGALTAAVALGDAVLDGLTVDGGLPGLVGFAAVVGLVNALIRPVVKALTLPLRIVTLGLLGLAINGALLLLAANLADTVEIDGFLAAVLAAAVISVCSAVLNGLVSAGVGR
jgi:putative membrane protein